MKFNEFTRNVLHFRKQAKELEALGYKRAEVDWKLQRGGYAGKEYKVEDVKISSDGKYVYYKLNQACVDYDKEIEKIKAENDRQTAIYQ